MRRTRSCFSDVHNNLTRTASPSPSLLVCLIYRTLVAVRQGDRFARVQQAFPVAPPPPLVVELGTKLGIKEGDVEAWYKVTNKDLVKALGSRFTNEFRNSRMRVLKALFPDHVWDASKFTKKPKKHFDSRENRVRYLEETSEKLGIKEGEYEKWYSIRYEHLDKVKRASILRFYGNSISLMLQDLIPNYPWDVSKFDTKPRNYWQSKDNQRKELKLLGEKLGIKDGDYEAWYKVTSHDLLRLGGSSLMGIYRRSISKTLMTLFPEHKWELNKFQFKPHRFWESFESQRELLLKIQAKLGVKEMCDWYLYSAGDLQKFGGNPLFAIHGRSLHKVLAAIFPDHPWDHSAFSVRPKGFWDSLDNQRKVLREVALKLGYPENDIARWALLTRDEIAKNGGYRLMAMYGGSPLNALKALYPNHNWAERETMNEVRNHEFVETLDEGTTLSADLRT